MIARKESMRESYARRMREKGAFNALQRSPLRRVSKKRAKEGKEYTEVSREFLACNPICQVCNAAFSTEVHHKRGRVGPLLCDIRFFLAVDSECHKAIHDDPKAARQLGLLAPAYEWNVSPP